MAPWTGNYTCLGMTVPPSNRIDEIFAALRANGRRALMPFVCGGAPRPDLTGELLLACERGGASVVEVGFPFSDPIADGPVIASAMHRALGQGASADSVMLSVSGVRPRLTIGVVAMVSVSIVRRSGTDDAGQGGGPRPFMRRLKDAGFDGVILPDVPLEESGPYAEAARSVGLAMPMLIAPTTPFARAESIAGACTGFVYMLTRTGITGTSTAVPDIGARVEKLRTVTDLPIACGFGISTPEQVAAVVRHADAAIVGSALVQQLEEAQRADQDPVTACEDAVRKLASGLP